MLSTMSADASCAASTSCAPKVPPTRSNLGFLNAANKKGNSLVEEMNRKVQKLKDDLELVKQKIKAIDAENKIKKNSSQSQPKHFGTLMYKKGKTQNLY